MKKEEAEDRYLEYNREYQTDLKGLSSDDHV